MALRKASFDGDFSWEFNLEVAFEVLLIVGLKVHSSFYFSYSISIVDFSFILFFESAFACAI